MIKKFNEYFNDSSIGEGDRRLMPDDDKRLSNEELELLALPLEQRRQIKNFLKTQTNEGKIGDWISRKMMSWLINRNEREIIKTMNVLTIFDPEDFSNVKKPEIIYLGGGMDKTTDGGEGWRREFEMLFGDDHVVKEKDVFKLGYTGKLDTKKYPKPILLDPTLKELIRKDPEFISTWDKLKAKTISPEEYAYMGRTINKEITNPDLRIVNKCDTIFARLDGTHGAGTLGELQIATLLNQNVFVWLIGKFSLKDLNIWIIPEINKIVRTDEELMKLINKIKKVNGLTV